MFFVPGRVVGVIAALAIAAAAAVTGGGGPGELAATGAGAAEALVHAATSAHGQDARPVTAAAREEAGESTGPSGAYRPGP
jgi:hypothetical protein